MNSSASERARLDLERDRLVGPLMGKPGGSATEIRTEVSPEEPDRAELAPLPHMNEFVSQQCGVGCVIPSEQDDPPQRHRCDTGCEPGDVDDAGAVDVGRRHDRIVALDAPNSHRR